MFQSFQIQGRDIYMYELNQYIQNYVHDFFHLKNNKKRKLEINTKPNKKIKS